MKMRLLNSLLFCITSFCYAISPYIRDFEFDFLKVDTSKITENICETYADAFVDSSQKSYFFENCFHDGGDVGFLSLLDTTVALYISAINTERPSFAMTRNQQACEGPSLADLKTTGLPGTHQFSEVLIFELLRFYELDFIENNRDSFEFQLNETVRKMIARDDYCVDLEFTDGIIGPGCCSLVESPSAIPLHSFVQNRLHATKISQGKFRIDGVILGSPYKLFDLNGKLLRSGVLQSQEATTPPSPAILDIAGKRLLLR